MDQEKVNIWDKVLETNRIKIKEEVDFLIAWVLTIVNFSSGSYGFDRRGGRGTITYQICFNLNHTVAKYKDKFNRNFILNPLVHNQFQN